MGEFAVPEPRPSPQQREKRQLAAAAAKAAGGSAVKKSRTGAVGSNVPMTGTTALNSNDVLLPEIALKNAADAMIPAEKTSVQPGTPRPPRQGMANIPINGGPNKDLSKDIQMDSTSGMSSTDGMPQMEPLLPGTLNVPPIETEQQSAATQEQLKQAELQLEQKHLEMMQQKNAVDTLNNRGEILVQQLSHARWFIGEEVLHRAKKEREDFKRFVAEDMLRLGKWAVDNNSAAALTGGVQGKWIDSSEGNKIDKDLKTLDEERMFKEELSYKLRKVYKTTGEMDEDQTAKFLEDREVKEAKTCFLARFEGEIKERENQLKIDRLQHLKQLKLARSQDASQFSQFPKIGESNRYQILNMIGRGGFSEVYKAFDLHDMNYCAIKIHQIRRDMGRDQAESYVKHATRETEIQKRLQHERVVEFKNKFGIDNTCFGCALELCQGVDLDTYLKQNGTIPEKEARGIIVQTLSGLRFMNKEGRKIIHYDLKPGNLMFHRGEIKITDFGLSKEVENHTGHDTCDLTSVGCGTYWYLPPECFPRKGDPRPRISNKVDVWSVGVIFFEILFGMKPFGEGLTQEHFHQQQTVGNEHSIIFPATPKISMECKDFIKRLLDPKVERRPNVFDAFADPYILRDFKK